MSIEETRRKIQELLHAKQALEGKITEASRAILPVLLDAGRVNSAKALQELLFEYDAKHQELTDFIMRDPIAAMDAMIKGMGGKP